MTRNSIPMHGRVVTPNPWDLSGDFRRIAHKNQFRKRDARAQPNGPRASRKSRYVNFLPVAPVGAIAPVTQAKNSRRAVVLSDATTQREPRGSIHSERAAFASLDAFPVRARARTELEGRRRRRRARPPSSGGRLARARFGQPRSFGRAPAQTIADRDATLPALRVVGPSVLGAALPTVQRSARGLS